MSGLDIEGVLAKWSGCWCGPQLAEDHDPRVRDCPQHGSDDCRHMAEGIVVDLRALREQIAAAQAEARADERARITAGIKRERDNYYTDTQNEGFDVAGRIARNGGHL